MPGPAGADDPALEQAQLAQLPPHAYQEGWRSRYVKQQVPARRPTRPGGHGSRSASSRPGAGQGGQAGGRRARPGARRRNRGRGGACRRARTGAHPKPVAPALKPGQREAGRLKALQMTQERKQIRDQLRQGSLSLAQALAQDGEAARGMRVVTVVRALPGIGAATAARLMARPASTAGRQELRGEPLREMGVGDELLGSLGLGHDVTFRLSFGSGADRRGLRGLPPGVGADLTLLESWKLGFQAAQRQHLTWEKLGKLGKLGHFPPFVSG